MILSKISAVVLLSTILAQAQDQSNCVNDCIGSTSQNFNCIALDLPCYCKFDNGQFFPKFRDCVQSKCPQYLPLIAAANCPSPSSSASVVPTTMSDTVTVTNKEPVTSTKVTSSVDTGTATFLDESTTAVFTTSGLVITTAVVEGSTTRTLTLTTQTVANLTTTGGADEDETSTGSSSGSGSGSGTVIVIPSTIQSTITSGGSTITSAVSTTSETTTTGEGNAEPTTTTTGSPAAANSLGQEVGGIGMVLAMGMGILGGWFGFM